MQFELYTFEFLCNIQSISIGFSNTLCFLNLKLQQSKLSEYFNCCRNDFNYQLPVIISHRYPSSEPCKAQNLSLAIIIGGLTICTRITCPLYSPGCFQRGQHPRPGEGITRPRWYRFKVLENEAILRIAAFFLAKNRFFGRNCTLSTKISEFLDNYF